MIGIIDVHTLIMWEPGETSEIRFGRPYMESIPLKPLVINVFFYQPKSLCSIRRCFVCLLCCCCCCCFFVGGGGGQVMQCDLYMCWGNFKYFCSQIKI